MARAIGIRVFKGEDLVDVHVFERDIIKIGRLASAHLRLDDPKVSRIHAVIDVASSGDEVSVIDMGSAEGTKVNQEKVSRVRLRHGDEIGLGDSRLVVVMEEAAVIALAVGDGARHSVAGETQATELVHDEGSTLGSLQSPPDDGGVFAGDAETVVDAGAFVAAKNEESRAQAASFEAAATTVAVGAATRSAPAATAPAATARAASVRGAQSTNAQSMQSLNSFVDFPTTPAIEDAITPENRHLEIAVRWGSDVVEVKRLRDVPKFTIGTDSGVDLFMPVDEAGGGSRFELVRQAPNSSEWLVRFTRQMNGSLFRNGEQMPLSAARAIPDGDALALSVTDDMQLDLAIGYMTLEIRSVAKSRIVPVVPLFDTFFANTMVAALFTMVGAVSLFTLLPRDLDDADGDLASNMAQFQTILLKPPPKDTSFLEKLKSKGKKATAAKADKGKPGDKQAVKTNTGKMEIKKVKEKSNEEIVAAKMQSLFGKEGQDGLAALFGGDAGGSALVSALGGISGDKSAGAYGEGGLGLRGAGPGGGGVATGTLGVGQVGTMGRGTGQGQYGAGTGGMGGKQERDISVSQGTPIVMGSLDKEIIRRIVRENQAQIKFCYEKELNRTPGIFGKVVMRWVIDGNGSVTQSKMYETTMKNKNVEDCMASKIRTWKFPKPKGGGIVIVNYPFVFKQSS